ncbi:MAG: DUF3298 and DUF4163 domain-containing protein [Bacteroidales bacterium]|nr:DUF3298 and DUF4163 domain-containing protein [Bacteroidales bacterium]
MKRVVIFCAALALLAGCSGLQTKTYQDDLVMPLSEGQEDSLFFTVSLEHVSGGMRVPLMEKINQAIVQQAFDLEETPGSLEEVATTYRENLIDEYLTENGSPEEETGVLTWEDKISGVFTDAYKNWYNYLITYYSYRGGAHGIQTVSKLVFDKETGEIVTENQLFAEGFTEPVSELMRASIKTEFEAEDPELLQLVEMDFVVPNGNFSVGANGIQWVFQPYEAGPYALGIVTASVSWKELKPYLK